MKVYIVAWDSYTGGDIIGVFADEEAAVERARAEARRTNEEFTGSIGYGVTLQAFDTDYPDIELEAPAWRDWRTKISGARVVLDQPSATP